MTELRKLEGRLRSVLQGVKSRDKPLEGRKRAMACIQLIKWRLDEAGIDPSLTRPLQDVLDALDEADRGIQHPLFAPAPLKGRPRASPTQLGVMMTTAQDARTLGQRPECLSQTLATTLSDDQWRKAPLHDEGGGFLTNETKLDGRLLTRREAVDLVRTELGIPIGLSTFQCGKRKLVPCHQESPLAPPAPAARYGRRYLYRQDDIRAWGRRLIATTT
jgi:hypothetical protein